MARVPFILEGLVANQIQAPTLSNAIFCLHIQLCQYEYGVTSDFTALKRATDLYQIGKYYIDMFEMIKTALEN